MSKLFSSLLTLLTVASVAPAAAGATAAIQPPPAPEAVRSPLADFIPPGRDTYFRIELEQAAGIDMRAPALTAEERVAAEKAGRPLRPSRSDAFVAYWAFCANGDFIAAEFVGDPARAHLGHAELARLFAKAPREGMKWSLSGRTLRLGAFPCVARLLSADDPLTGGKAGELEIAVLHLGQEKYRYYGRFVAAPAAPASR